VKKDFYNLEKEENFDLKAELKSIGMTQKDFAEYTGFHLNSVGRWVRQEIEIPKWAIVLIENYKKAKLFEELTNKLK
jgi:transcriptional regulator with XRE-family HTH domain